MLRTCVFLPDGTVDRDCPVTESYEPPAGALAWVDMEEPTQEELALLAGRWHFHPLAVEDCVHPQRLSKFERFPTHGFLVFHALDPSTEDEALDTMGVRVFLRAGLVVTVHPRPLPAIDRTWHDAKIWPERFARSAEWLVHVIVDGIVDDFTRLLYTFEDRVDALEARATSLHNRRLVPDMVRVRRDLLMVRRIVLPQREVVRRFCDADDPDFGPDVRVYFRDVLDHVEVVHDTTSLLLDICNGALQIHADMVNERLNQVMKYMAIVSTLLLPMTVISGAFGMNFVQIPLSAHPHGFTIALVLMLASASVLLVLFRIRRWF